MEHPDNPPLSTLRQCAANALAGATLHRPSLDQNPQGIHHWPSAAPARRPPPPRQPRPRYLHAILDDPPAVLFKTAAFILTRPQMPKTGWTMPEPSPKPGDNKLTGSATLEQDYDSLPGLCRH